MPPRKRQQSNAMLYTLIAFVGLFIAAATAAIIYYVKAEDYKKDFVIEMFSQDLKQKRTWKFFGAFPTDIDFGSLDKSSTGDQLTLSATLVYDTFDLSPLESVL